MGFDPEECHKVTCAREGQTCDYVDTDTTLTAGQALHICGTAPLTCFSADNKLGNCTYLVAVGQSCHDDQDCQGIGGLINTFCDTANKTCKKQLGVGEKCTREFECQGRLMCAQSGVCIEPHIGKLGEACVFEGENDCLLTLSCANGICQKAFQQYAEVCGWTGPTNTTFLECAYGLTCVDGYCAKFQTGNIGNTCSDTMSCEPGMVCSTQGKCSNPAFTHWQGCDKCEDDGLHYCTCDFATGSEKCVPLQVYDSRMADAYKTFAQCMIDTRYDIWRCRFQQFRLAVLDPNVEHSLLDWCFMEH